METKEIINEFAIRGFQISEDGLRAMQMFSERVQLLIITTIDCYHNDISIVKYSTVTASFKIICKLYKPFQV